MYGRCAGPSTPAQSWKLDWASQKAEISELLMGQPSDGPILLRGLAPHPLGFAPESAIILERVEVGWTRSRDCSGLPIKVIAFRSKLPTSTVCTTMFNLNHVPHIMYSLPLYSSSSSTRIEVTRPHSPPLHCLVLILATALYTTNR